MREAGLRRTSFLLLLIAVSVAFACVVRPFAGAVFWAVALAIVFMPLYRRLLGATRQRRGLAALATLLACLVGVVLPLLLIAASLVGEGRLLYADVLSRRIDFGAYFQRVFDGLPHDASEGDRHRGQQQQERLSAQRGFGHERLSFADFGTA